MESYKPTDRSRVHRHAERAKYDTATVHAILDSSSFAHVGIVQNGQPLVIPMGYARAGEVLYLHGSPGSRLLRQIAEGVDVCVTVTLLDGMVFARSVFNHSMNYGSAVVFGKGRLVDELEEKKRAMFAFTEQLIPGRWDEARTPSENELKGTTFIAVDIIDASAKMRTGPVIDDDVDLVTPIWGGVVPLTMVAGEPNPDSHNSAGSAVPASIEAFRRRHR